MTLRSRARGGGLPVWERGQPAHRPAPTPLSREGVVDAAIQIADTEDIDSVSLRRVAAALGAGPMRLYGYIATKEELLDLMVDAVYAEMAFPVADRDSWRTGAAALAGQMRAATIRHPWFAALLGGRPHQGPNGLAYLEALFAVLSLAPGNEAIDPILQAAKAFNAYVIGAIRNESSERSAAISSGMTKEEWQQATGPYLQRMIETGRFPWLARVYHEAQHPVDEQSFFAGLSMMLDGVEAYADQSKSA